MNVSITPTLRKFIQDEVKSGYYNSASEVVREALRRLQRHDEPLFLQKVRRKKKTSVRPR